MMITYNKAHSTVHYGSYLSAILFLLILPLILLRFGYSVQKPGDNFSNTIPVGNDSIGKEKKVYLGLDTSDYDNRNLRLVHNKPGAGWPVNGPYPLAGALLPYHRIVAYYGNFLSKGMGILGEFSEAEVLKHLRLEASKWQSADPQTPVIAAVHYIAVTAQDQPGSDGNYRLRMPQEEIAKALRLADSLHGIVFLDVQLGWSTLEAELPLLEPYLKLPNVHLGIDPEYDMEPGQVPCSIIGSMDAAEINYASMYLAGLVRKYRLIPKILVVHRFTKEMVRHYQDVKLRPEVQVVMDMDGFGFPAKKRDSYKNAIVREPVQFTGFKLFYRYDLSAKYPRVMNPDEVLDLYPKPIYIQYQ